MSRSIRGGGIWSKVFHRRMPAFKSAGHLHVPGWTRCRSETPGQWHSRYFFPITGHFPALPTIRDHHRPTRPRQRCFSLSFRFFLPKKATMVKKMRSRSTTAVAIVLLCSTLRLAAAISDGLLPNGNFEAKPNASELKGTQVMSRFAIPNWEVTGFVEYIESGHKQGDMLLLVPEGAYAVRLGNEASIKQVLNLSKGTYYAITFSAARTCAQDERLNISVTPDSGVLPVQTAYSSTGWDCYSWAFLALFDRVTLVIHNLGVEEDPACGPLIDAVAIKTLNPPRLTKENLLKNRDFEEGPYVLPNTTWGVLIPPNIEDDHSPLPGWMVESLKAVKYIDSDHFAVPHGKRAVELVAGKESALAQAVRTTPGRTYALTFSVGDAGDGCEGSMVVEAFAARSTVKVPYESSGSGGYKRGVLRFVAIAERTRVVFLSTYYHTKTDGTLCGPVVDDASVLSVRSPSHRRR